MSILLFKRGVDLTVVDPMGNNVFHYAARSGRVKNIEWLSQKLPSHIRLHLINAGNNHHINTPLHFAAKYSHVKSVDALLCLGAKKSNKNLQNKTAEELNVTPEVKKIFEMYPTGSVPTLVWLAAKISAKVNLNIPETIYMPEMQDLINLEKTGNVFNKNKSENAKTRKRSNSV